MTEYRLMPHPDFPPIGVTGVRAGIVVTGPDSIELTYAVDGAGRLVMPDVQAPARADELWRTTCFEMFLRPVGRDGYVEFNFSPSTRWAAYAFDGHRKGMRDLPRPAAPRIEPLDTGMVVGCDLSGVPGGAMAMGLTAIIEEEGGTRSYWALAHAPGPPDFHNPAGFIARLPVA